jgi:lipopolysaccharide export system protein LptA
VNVPALLLLSAVALLAKPEASTGSVPVHVDADRVEWLPKTRQVVFLGKPFVRLRREDATLLCRKLVAKNDAQGQIETADCTGDVRLERGEQVVTCETATFNNAAGRVVCRGKPVVLRDGQSVMRGDELTYELESGNAVLTGKPANGLVVPKPGQTLRPMKKKEGAP